MLKVDKKSEPKFFKEFKRKVKPRNWDDFGNIKSDLKNFILENEQKLNGEFYCPYCEQKISESNSHIEHIEPKGKFPSKFDKYENLIISCNSKNHCGHYKDSPNNKLEFDSEKFINPTKEDPSSYFDYDIKTGEIVGKNKASLVKVEYTTQLLNLNGNRELLEARKKIFIVLSSDIQSSRLFIDFYHDFPTLIDWFKVNFLN